MIPIDPVRSDAQIIAASVVDPSEFGDLYARHGPAIHRYLARRLGVDIADDLTADTFTTAFRVRDRFDAARAPHARPWLYGIASNLAARHRRAEVRALRALARTGVDEVADSWVERADQRLAAEALSRPLAEALASLSPGDRDTLLLVAWADLTYDEVAQALRLPVGTVRSRLHRARRKVREAVADHVPGRPPDVPATAPDAAPTSLPLDSQETRS
ncbi:RNA polymerase sigma factor [Nocardioides sp. SOB77]|uniref:RNA polymerase sigma factor n=1 Tax=Nocardioides oceani TaxID=3058369 RepID=A0ABT8FHF4_9ACTN|nr:RNA polymerase sigma factor [Nocardioides oceani]MDN4173981.1 RNA polymerase sigma factor [Nocardioides oceani]